MVLGIVCSPETYIVTILNPSAWLLGPSDPYGNLKDLRVKVRNYC